MKEKEVRKTKNKILKHAGILALMITGMLFGGMYAVNNVSAVGGSINLTISSETLGIDLTPSVGGTFVKSDNLAISVTTTSYQGYTLNIAASNSQELVGSGMADGKSFTTFSESISEETFSKDSTYNGKWGYLPSRYGSKDNSDTFYPAPTTTGDTLDVTDAPNSTANEYTIAIGARADATASAGTYSNTFVISAVANQHSLNVIYDGNGLYFDNDSSKTTNLVIYDATRTGSAGAYTYSKTILNGAYKTPALGATAITFAGWSESADATAAAYANESDISTKLAAVNDEADVTLYAIWGNNLTITFDKNANDATGTMSAQTIAAGSSANLTANGFEQSGYDFSGWNTKADGSGDSYDDKGSFTVAVTNRETSLTLYAQWEEVKTKSILDVKASGDAAPSNCSTTSPIRNLQQAEDPRDGSLYWVGELCDGNVWMLDNLKLDLTNSEVLNKMTSSNTNATDEAIGHLKNGGGSTSDKWPTAKVTKWTSSYSYSVPMVNADYKDDKATVVYGPGSGEIGTYYNYCAASAGTYCWGNGTSYSGSPTSDPKSGTLIDIDGDICPKGWHMPTSTSSGEFQALYTAYGSNATASSTSSLQYNLSTPLSGFFNNGTQDYVGTYGYFWSSTWYGTNYMYRLYVNDSYVGPSDGYGRDYGYSVRCVRGSS